MKYALLFLFILFSNLQPSYAKNIKSFSDSTALTNIAQFMIESSEDLPVSNRISDMRLVVKDTSSCVQVNKEAVINDVGSAIFNVLRFYPDEELPIEEALSDLSDYLKSDSYFKCVYSQNNIQALKSVTYYFDIKNEIHVKVDTIALHD